MTTTEIQVLQQDFLPDSEKMASRDLVSKIFVAMVGIFGERWSKNFTDSSSRENAITEWSKGLASLNEQDMRYAVGYLRQNSNYPPTINVFLRVANRLPDSNAAFASAQNGELSHQAARLAYDRAGGSWAIRQNQEKFRNMFFIHYASIVEKIVSKKLSLSAIPLTAPINYDDKITNEEYLKKIHERYGDKIYNKCKAVINKKCSNNPSIELKHYAQKS